MKALVLSAGFGTRLTPHTLETPKPLFPVCGRPIIDIIISRLAHAGVTGIAVNTHYMADKIEAFLNRQNYGVDIHIRYEPRLLGTGGAVGNFSDFLADGPFIVINSDVLTDIDIREIHDAHMAHDHPVTLVMHDHPLFNKVSVCPDGFIHGFSGKIKNSHKGLAFTGISIIDPSIYRFITPGRPECIIDVYRRMIRADEKIAARIVTGHYWNDLGTPVRYRDAVSDHMTPRVFEQVYGKTLSNGYKRQKLAGDGSDRKWYRITRGDDALIMADHGIHSGKGMAQADAFVKIGDHLYNRGIPVPRIYDADRFSGLVFMQDLGDDLLQTVVSGLNDPEAIAGHYRNIIRTLLDMSVEGQNGFDPAWAYEGAQYDRQVIIEKECLYFTGRFLKGYLGYTDFNEQSLSGAFDHLAGGIAANAYEGLMHRDLQSRNIMVKDGRHYLIDFQGARIGPVQYDLASLLADPYVNLDYDLQNRLLDHAMTAMEDRIGSALDRGRFIKGFRYCCISRLMQALGAFGFLSKIKNKTWFEQYMPAALDRLQFHLETLAENRLDVLTEIVSGAAARFRPEKAPGQPAGQQ